MFVKEARLYTEKKLFEAGIAEAKTDADLLVAAAAGIERKELFLCGEKEVGSEAEARLKEWVERRIQREPLQHILGEAWFFGRSFFVDKSVLVPRPETELLVEEALLHIKKGDRVLDLFTGSGCIAISIFLEMKGEIGAAATDISKEALRSAQRNAKKHGAHIRFAQGDVFLALQNDEIFDIITANPPYIREDEIDSLEPEVKDFDPFNALSGGEDGLIFYRLVAAGLDKHLAEGGRFITEIGWDQCSEVSHIFSDAGFCCEKVISDYSGHDRVLVFARKGCD